MKRIIVSFAAAALLALPIAGCSGAQQQAPAESQPSEAAQILDYAGREERGNLSEMSEILSEMFDCAMEGDFSTCSDLNDDLRPLWLEILEEKDVPPVLYDLHQGEVDVSMSILSAGDSYVLASLEEPGSEEWWTHFDDAGERVEEIGKTCEDLNSMLSDLIEEHGL